MSASGPGPVVAVSGYAGLDHAMAVPALPATDTTAVVTRRLSDPWPGWGGCGPYVARRLAAEGVSTRLVTWLGDDAGGHAYRRLLDDEAVGVDGVVLSPGQATATTYLFYDQGSSLCFYDPGASRDARLASAQQAVLAEADWLVLTVGPRRANAALLEGLRRRPLVWAVKADADAFPPALVRRCLAEASVVALSAGELRFLKTTVAPDDPFALLRDDAVVLTTLGAQGVGVRSRGRETLVRVKELPVRDTTGAGDTFLAGAVAALLRDPGDAEGAAVAGARAAAALLASRLGSMGVSA